LLLVGSPVFLCGCACFLVGSIVNIVLLIVAVFQTLQWMHVRFLLYLVLVGSTVVLVSCVDACVLAVLEANIVAEMQP
jgi:hypothetical protein